MGRTILLVCADALLRDALVDQFAAQGEFDVETAASGAEALDRARADPSVDLALIDETLPDMGGAEICRALRLDGFRPPVVTLTSRDGPPGPDEAPEGANDCLAKPFRFAALLACARAHLRSHEQSEDARLRIGPFAFDPATKTLTDAAGETIRLTEKETSILKFLHRAGGRAVPREVLLDRVWGYNSGVATHTLETHVYRLRRKLDPDAGAASLLVTEDGGYRLATEAARAQGNNE